jgi:hypothetical protein
VSEKENRKAVKAVRVAVHHAVQLVPFSLIVDVVDEEMGWTLTEVMKEMEAEEAARSEGKP